MQAARTLCADVLAPHAAEADDPARGVTARNLALVAEAGLLSVTMPADDGGFGGTARVEAEVVELQSGACAATWFVGTQHRTPQQMSRGGPGGLAAGDIAIGPAADRYRAALAAARERAGIAVAHLRRPGRPAVTAEPDGTGWRLRGHADWCTGWGLLDLVMIGATTPEDRFGVRAGPGPAPGPGCGPGSRCR